VPILTIPLPTTTAPNSQSPFLPASSASLDLDLTLLRLLPQITGTQTVAQLAHNADVDLSLARKAIAHLLYYGCIVLLDVFQYGAVYAPTAQIGAFIEDEALQRECCRYVSAPWSSADGLRGSRRSGGRGTGLSTSPGNSAPNEWWDAVVSASQPGSGPASYREKLNYMRTRTTSPSPGATPSPGRTPAHSRNPSNVPARNATVGSLSATKGPDVMTLIALYTSLRQGVPLRAWCLEHSALLVGIDVRRLITFGVIKGFLYRVHRYAISTGSTSLNGPDESFSGLHHSHTPGRSNAPSDAALERDEKDFALGGRDLPLTKYLDGNHSFDQMCTDLEMGEREVMGKLKGFGEVHIVNR
jgi:nitrogen permease regulator 2-like protein